MIDIDLKDKVDSTFLTTKPMFLMKQPNAISKSSREITSHDGLADPCSYRQLPNERMTEPSKIITQREVVWRTPASNEQLLKVAGLIYAGLHGVKLIVPLAHDYSFLDANLVASSGAIGPVLGGFIGYKYAQFRNKPSLGPMVFFGALLGGASGLASGAVDNHIRKKYKTPLEAQQSKGSQASLFDANAEETLQLTQTGPACIASLNNSL